MSVSQINRATLYGIIRLLSLVAIFFASMLAVDYYFAHNTFCAEGAACSVVAQSEFGQKYGIFLPTLGLVAYSFFFLTSFFFAKTKAKILGKSLSTFWLPLAILCSALGAFLFIIVQAFEIHAFCWLCMGIDTAAMLAVIPAVLLMKNKNEQVAEPRVPKMLLVGVYLLVACAPIAWGTRPQEEPAKPVPEQTNDAQSADEAKTPVPSYIQSFYLPNKINVVEISSFDCPHCRQLHPQLTELLNSYGDRVNFTRLTIPLGKKKEACVAYYCAEKQKKETQYADCLFEEPSKDAEKLLEYARECSINEDTFKSCLTDPASAQAVDEMLAKIRTTGFQGAPTIWINDQNIVGFDRSKGMAPYKAAIEKDNPVDAAAAKAAEDASHATELAAKARANVAFHTTLLGLIAALLCLIGGAAFAIMRKPKVEHTQKDDDSSAPKEDDSSAQKDDDLSAQKDDDKQDKADA